jgi:hypothetical protein
VIINDSDCGGYGEDTVLPMWGIFHSQSTAEASALL